MDLLPQPEWHDFGPTYACQQLAKQGVNVSDETLGRWMIGAENWKPNTRTSQTVPAWRARRSGLGELVEDDRRSYGPRGDVHGNASADAIWTRSARVGNWLHSARSPQAKGGLERSFRTDQDRLVTDLRLAKIITLEAANGRIAPEG